MISSDCSLIYFSLNPQTAVIFSHPATNIVVSTVIAGLNALSITINASFLTIMCYDRYQKGRNNANKAMRPNSHNSRDKNQISVMLMISLSCSDLAYSTFVMPFCVLEVIENGRWLFGEILCHARSVMVYYFLSVSIYHVACMAIDRYIAVSKPFLYRNFTKKTGYVMIGVSWIFPVLIQLMPHFLGLANVEDNVIFKCHGKDCLHIFKQGSFIACIIIGFCIPFLIPYLCYILILRIVIKFNMRRKKHVGKLNRQNKPAIQTISGPVRKTIPITQQQTTDADAVKRTEISILNSAALATEIADRHTETYVVADGITNDSSRVGRSGPEPKLGPRTDVAETQAETSSNLGGRETVDVPYSSKPAPVKRNVKAYGTVGSVLVCFTLCWSPTCGFVVTFLRAGDPMQPWFFVMVMWIANLNMALNPILYCLNRSVRRAVNSFLRRS